MSALPQVKEGDRVRISVEGKVIAVSPVAKGTGKGRLQIERTDGRRGVYFYGKDAHTELTVLPPEYADGGIYVDACNEVLRYTATGRSGERGWRRLDPVTQEWYANTAWPFEYAALPVKRIDAPEPARAHVGKTPWISRQDSPWDRAGAAREIADLERARDNGADI